MDIFNSFLLVYQAGYMACWSCWSAPSFHKRRESEGAQRFCRALTENEELLGGELPTARKWVITPVIYMG